MRYRLLGAVVLACIAGLCGCSKQASSAPPEGPKSAPQTEPAAKSDPPAAADDAQKVFESTCSACHALTRVRKYQGTEPWNALVNRMISQHGAKVTPEAAKQIVGYLDQAFPKKK